MLLRVLEYYFNMNTRNCGNIILVHMTQMHAHTHARKHAHTNCYKHTYTHSLLKRKLYSLDLLHRNFYFKKINVLRDITTQQKRKKIRSFGLGHSLGVKMQNRETP